MSVEQDQQNVQLDNRYQTGGFSTSAANMSLKDVNPESNPFLDDDDDDLYTPQPGVSTAASYSDMGNRPTIIPGLEDRVPLHSDESRTGYENTTPAAQGITDSGQYVNTVQAGTSTERIAAPTDTDDMYYGESGQDVYDTGEQWADSGEYVDDEDYAYSPDESYEDDSSHGFSGSADDILGQFAQDVEYAADTDDGYDEVVFTHGDESYLDEEDSPFSTDYESSEYEDYDDDEYEEDLASDYGEEAMDALGSIIDNIEPEKDLGFNPDDEDEALFRGFKIDEIITEAIDMGASDIHIDSNKRIAFRVLGDIIRDEKRGIIPGEVTTRIYENITSHVNQQTLTETFELDASYVVRAGKYHGRRLRMSVGKSFGQVFLVFRIINDVIPTPDDLGVDPSLVEWTNLSRGGFCLGGATGSGKDLKDTTLIPGRFPGGFKALKDIQVGDIVFDENGDDCVVIKKHKGGSERFYDIHFSNGQVVRAGGNHLWNVYNLNEIPVYNAKSNLSPVFTDSEIDEFTQIGVSSDELSKISRDELMDITETTRTRTALSLWLDNHFTGSPSTITGPNPRMMYPARKVCMSIVEDHFFRAENEDRTSAPDRGVMLTLTTQQLKEIGVMSYENGNYQRNWGVPLLSGPVMPYDGRVDPSVHPYNFGTEVVGESDYSKVQSVLEDEVLSWSPENKVMFMMGVAGTGSLTQKISGYTSVTLSDRSIAEKVRSVACSLGWEVESITEKSNHSNESGKSYTFYFTPVYNLPSDEDDDLYDYDYDESSAGSLDPQYMYITKIVEVKDDPDTYFCLEVDSPSHLFLCSESYIPTHNTTTFASLIRQMQLTRQQKIITIEKPIEFMYPDDGKAFITQREVGSDAKSFSNALVSAMRQDPDVILVGEVRNRIEVDEFLRAAETGHLALTTIHTNTPPATINRIRSLYTGDDQIRIMASLEENMRGIANQTLLKTPDGKGRFALFSVLNFDREVRRLIREGNLVALEDYMRDRQTTIEYRIAEAVNDGRCSEAEGLSHAPDPIYLKSLLKKHS